MLPTGDGSIRLFRFAGISVYLHWSWFLVAVYQVNVRAGDYSSAVWNVLEYLALFMIVLLHEFGHSLACRQVGGKADQIVLWPLGGVAYVAPPPRPGPILWSIAAGPLVNVLLVPVLTLLFFSSSRGEWPANLHTFVSAVWIMNFYLLGFNLLPIFPLDGGQILRALLWFVVGRARSLMIASITGFCCVALVIVLAVALRSIWIGILGAFILMNCWRGLQQARILSRLAKMPRHPEFTCPECRQPPVLGEFWRCPKCAKPFDPFASQSRCPYCGEIVEAIPCPECSSQRPLADWRLPASFR